MHHLPAITIALAALFLPASCRSSSSVDEKNVGELPWRSLFDGETLAGWTSLGDAIYQPDDGSILGEVGGGGQSFLVTRETFADFVFEVDVKPELPGNSGIQVRSHAKSNGRVYGYQIEIDSSKRAWSGGLYDEARRGWLDDLKQDEVARQAFRPGEWNRYRIECRGPRIRAWVNGVQTADHVDPLDLEGFIGLQVHSGDNTRVRWRDLRLQDLGKHEWRPAAPREVAGALLVSPRPEQRLKEGDFALRLRYRDRPGLSVDIHRTGETEPVWTLEADVLREAHGEEEWSELFLASYGPRLVVHVDGKLILERHTPDTGHASHVVFHSAGQEVPVSDAELLVPLPAGLE